ncbi:hypothetical protein PUNSTDRAFT_131729 [Punctularia strigosozonata HHB-11173 SS5]|uniref:uncharacterized protein n=1 Tax=Punctularia strigosozonata (strain HHB-11173) TaxID=741275 RepID=UPI000441775E|nr:uncharacterized protein PUNSTDRAFT_131729 [Punctularia strigosozonata HHB-11173 SS5]EIN11566.1 hypothetical protein PUNSTDRAFT_131729 [Punctularia strigosozonata HHB-11173 SS5]
MFFSGRYSALLSKGSKTRYHDHATITAPLFTGEALSLAGETVFPQYALYGHVIEQEAPGFASTIQVSQVFVNSNSPFSAVICGVQGSGKSHSTSVLLESCLIKDDRVGTLGAPLSGLLFHFDTAAGGGDGVQPCEAAYLASLDPLRGENAIPPAVTVLVLPSSLKSMRKVYKGLSVDVRPLHFAERDISAERLLCMMKVDGDSQMPLYMSKVMAHLRKMDQFSYSDFLRFVEEEEFAATQKAMLKLRLGLLDACLEGGTDANSVSTHFGRGKLVIIDLSSPFMDASSACGFFDMILGIFIEAKVDSSGKIVVLDEAHKYLTERGASSRLTESLLSVIRQQRHLRTRVVISTQEPTVVPSKILDLSKSADLDPWFSKIVSLGTGEALVFASSGLSVRELPDGAVNGADRSIHGVKQIAALGAGYLHVKSRLRITIDGGQSMLAIQVPVLDSDLGEEDEASSHASHKSRDICEPHARSAHHNVTATKSNPVREGKQRLQESSPPPNWAELAASTPTAHPPVISSTLSSTSSEAGSSTTSGSSTSDEVPNFSPLVEFLQDAPANRAKYSIIGDAIRSKYPGTYPVGKGELTKYIAQAAACGIVTVGGSGVYSWAQLQDDTRPSLGHDSSEGSDSEASSDGWA